MNEDKNRVKSYHDVFPEVLVQPIHWKTEKRLIWRV